MVLASSGQSESARRAFRLAGSLSFFSDNDFFGDVMTKSLGLTGYIVHVRLRRECID